MRAALHAAAAGLTAFAAGYFLLTSYEQAASCGTNILNFASSCAYSANYRFVPIGMVFGLAAAVEIVMTMQRRKTGALVWEMARQKTIRKLGTVLVFAGAALTTYGLYSMSDTLFGCTALGCSTSYLWQAYLGYEIPFYIGLIAATAGLLFVLCSSLLKVKTEYWRRQIVLPSQPS